MSGERARELYETLEISTSRKFEFTLRYKQNLWKKRAASYRRSIRSTGSRSCFLQFEEIIRNLITIFHFLARKEKVPCCTTSWKFFIPRNSAIIRRFSFEQSINAYISTRWQFEERNCSTISHEFSLKLERNRCIPHESPPNYLRRWASFLLLTVAVSQLIAHRSSIETAATPSRHPRGRRGRSWTKGDESLAAGNCCWRDCTSSFLDWSCTCRTHRCRGAAGSSRRWAAPVPPAAVVRCCSAASTCRCRRRCSRRSPRRYRRAWPAAARSRPTIPCITHPAAWPCRSGPRRARRWWCRALRRARCRRSGPRRCRRPIRTRTWPTRRLTRTSCWRSSRGTRIWKVSDWQWQRGMRLEKSVYVEERDLFSAKCVIRMQRIQWINFANLCVNYVFQIINLKRRVEKATGKFPVFIGRFLSAEKIFFREISKVVMCERKNFIN